MLCTVARLSSRAYKNKMIKKIVFSLILFSTLFVAQGAFADFQYIKEVAPTNVSGNTYCFKDTDYDEIRSWGAWPDGMGMTFITNTSFFPINMGFGGNTMDCTGGYTFNLDNFPSDYGLSNGNYFLLVATRRPANYQASDFPDPFKAIYFEFSVSNGDVSYIPPVSPLVSDIDKISLYTLNNEDLSEITTPIPFDAGYQIHFFNYEEDSYQYLAYNMTICHNGHLEGCTYDNTAYIEDYIDISSLGFSTSGQPPLSVKINFKDVVSQSDLINISFQLSNCTTYGVACPGGNSDGRGYTYLINDSLASDSWLTFDDPARPDCSIARLDVCLINAVNYFIKPRSSGFANSFSVASTRINERIPFVYLYAVRDSISEIFNSPTASVNWSVSFGSVGSLSVLDSDSFSGSAYYSFFTGMRVYLGYLLWILLGVGLYKRAVRLFDDKTVS